MSKAVKTTLLIVLVIVLGIGIYFVAATLSKNERKRATSEFLQLMQSENTETGDKRIVKVEFDGYCVYGYTSVKSGNYSYWTYYANMYTGEGADKVEEWVEKIGRAHV